MARKKQQLSVRVGGEDIPLALTLGTFRRFEEARGKSALDSSTWNEMESADLLALIWAAMPKEAREKYPADSEEFADEIDFVDAMRAMKALEGAIQGNS